MSLYIAVNTLEYPLWVDQIRRRHPTVSFPKEIPNEVLATFGYAPVIPSIRPEGDVVTETAPFFNGEQYVQMWETREFTQVELDQQINTSRNELLALGIDYTFPGDVADKIKVDDRDMTILTSLRVIANEQLGNPEYRQVFRSMNNVNYTLTAQEIIDMTSHVFATVDQIYKNSWNDKT